MPYRRLGSSGLKLPAISLGLWHNFGGDADADKARALVRTAFDHGITHFDLANNYGPPPGSAETLFGTILRDDLRPYRDELIISSKAGYGMWDGPYGDGGSRKYLLASLDASLRRLGVEYVDIFYHHRPDPETPLEETAAALDQAVRSGKALYVGISNYPADLAVEMLSILKAQGTPAVIHQPSYNIFNRRPETSGLFAALTRLGVGSIVFSPLAQGMLTGRYLNGVPKDSRAASDSPFLSESSLDVQAVRRISALNGIASERGQTLAEMALTWVLRTQRTGPGPAGDERPVAVTSALIGASRPQQILDNVRAATAPALTDDELATIDEAATLD